MVTNGFVHPVTKLSVLNFEIESEFNKVTAKA